jgi:WD40 repeat protein
VSGSYDGTARVWDVKSGEAVQGLNPIKTGHEAAAVYAVSYSPEAKMIAMGGYNEHGIQIWDAKSGELLPTVIEIEHKGSISSLTWTSDEKKLIAGSIDNLNLIMIFGTATWQCMAVLRGHSSAVPPCVCEMTWLMKCTDIICWQCAVQWRVLTR